MLKLHLPIAIIAGFGLASAAFAAPITTFTYNYSSGTGLQTPNATYPDSTGGANTELNNNVLGGGGSFTGNTAYQDPQWVGFGPDPAGTSPTVRINVTFTQAYNFTSLTVAFLVDTTFAQTHTPSNLSIRYNGGSPVAYSGGTPGWTNAGTNQVVHTNVLNLTGQSGTTLQLDFTPTTTDGTWMFLSELDFDGTPVPEPASAALLLGAGLLATRRRVR